MNTIKCASALAMCAVIAGHAGAAPKPLAPAPAFKDIEKWLNSPPLTMEGLRGKVVLVDFWTYDCINCIRTLPYIAKWHKAYKDQGLVVVGVHTPEYAFERNTENVRAAMQRFGITYPVAQDNRYGTWEAYGNRYWPAVYLIDKQGRITWLRRVMRSLPLATTMDEVEALLPWNLHSHDLASETVP
ncbi:MAG: redoxin family protein [Pseudomonadota bacterium]